MTSFGLSKLEAQSGSVIQLSDDQDHFPGTTERIMLLKGLERLELTAVYVLFPEVLLYEFSCLVYMIWCI